MHWEKIMARRRRVSELANQGLSCKDISEKLGWSPLTISNDLKAHSNVSFTVLRRERPTERQIQAFDMRALGYSYLEIGETLGIGREGAAILVRRYIKKVPTDRSKIKARGRRSDATIKVN